MAKKEKPKRVQPQLLKGFRDYPPAEQLARERMLAKLRENFERMGFLPLQTASLEFAETLLGPHYSSDSLAELFGFRGPDDVDMALRYEFTVSLARYVASQPHLQTPFRRYQYGNVWRVDKPGPGRFREFMQFDIDIVGTLNLLADAEIIAAMVTTFQHLDIEHFVVRYSNRKILNGLIEWAGVEVDRGPDVMRVIDKLEKQGKDAVLLELGPGRIDSSGDRIPGLGLASAQITRLEAFLDVAQHQKGDPLDRVHKLLGDVSISDEGISELRQIDSHLTALGIDKTKTQIDMTVVRGLGYYTGPVFETTLLDLPEYGSVFSGGRYDNLVERFSSQSLPAVGSSVGVDRLLAALLQLQTLPLQSATADVLVTVMDPDRLSSYLEILGELRNAGIASEIFVGETKNLTKQIKYGDRVGIPFAVIAGSNEFDRGEVTVKNMAAGARVATDVSDREEWLRAEGFQETIPRGNLVSYLKQRMRRRG
ncbi:MAG: histidine--tRNA ligase [candidate division Zixibacteria bacterium]|jgi:histidyl-tRNA synthetase|nr:histidine--tRNA ligase [candidate division Zixibacteria bacterium]